MLFVVCMLWCILCCVLFDRRCLLCVVCFVCVSFIIACVLVVGYGSMRVACCMSFGGSCLLLVLCGALFVVSRFFVSPLRVVGICRLLFVVIGRCSLFVVCCVLCVVVRSMMFVVCCLLVVACVRFVV